ncbi:MAG: flagellar basal body rod protein FlgC [Gammaproteobacteria bacterium]|nr:flagellar basal body rod protein FlgC [Gammaproteobacteria bacterium]
MSLFNIFNISGSGMSAQTLRMNTTASNIANAESVSSSTERTYRARHPVFAVERKSYGDEKFNFPGWGDEQNGGAGVSVMGIVESAAPLVKRYEPQHPSADEAGYVSYPNVNVVEEMANMISASRSFQTNVEVLDTAKQMMQKVLTMGR